MDKMEFFEIRALMKHQYYAYKNSWEQARLIAYVTAQVNSTKKIKMADIMNFPWDNEADNSNITKEAVSNEHVATLRAKAEEVAKMLSQ